jgi:YD repeat-containing protein
MLIGFELKALLRTVFVLLALCIMTAPSAVAGVTTYTYDGLNRLHQVDYPGGSIVYTYDELGNMLTKTASGQTDLTPPTTTASPSGGIYPSAQTITLSTSEQSTIYYTIDGTTPTMSSPVYSSPLTILANTVLRFFAKDLAGNVETPKMQTYSIVNGGGGPFVESFTASILPVGWTVQGYAALTNVMFHDGANSLQLGDSFNTDGSISFIAPSTGNLSFWFSKISDWGYNWDNDGSWDSYGNNVGNMTVSVNGTVVYTVSSDTWWLKTPLINVHAGDTVKIAQTGNSDDGGDYCAQNGGYCDDEVDPYYNVAVYIDDVSITPPSADITPPITSASPNGGSYSSPQTVTLTANEQAVIYYTTDRTTPTISSAVYATPLSIPATTTLTYFAKDTAGNSEAIKTQTYTVDIIAPVTTATPAGGTYSSAQTVTLSANESATIYYTTDGSAPTPSWSVYSGPLTISSTTTLKYFATDQVGNVEASKLQSYTINLDFASVRNFRTNIAYSTVQGAYNAALSGDILKLTAQSFTENLAANLPISITIDGGYSTDFSSNAGVTNIVGTPHISNGHVAFKNIHIHN